VTRRGQRLAVIGATGTLGSDVIEVLGERDYPVAELLPVATDESLGEDVELQGRSYPVLTGSVALRGTDLAFLCVPAEAAAPWIRRGLEEQVPCVDLSGSLADREEVPIGVAELATSRGALRQPLVTSPPGLALAFALLLAPLRARFGLRRDVRPQFRYLVLQASVEAPIRRGPDQELRQRALVFEREVPGVAPAQQADVARDARSEDRHADAQGLAHDIRAAFHARADHHGMARRKPAQRAGVRHAAEPPVARVVGLRNEGGIEGRAEMDDLDRSSNELESGQRPKRILLGAQVTDDADPEGPLHRPLAQARRGALHHDCDLLAEPLR